MKLKMHIDYKAYPYFVDDLGLDTIEEAEATAAKMEVEACPFCGAMPELYLGDFYRRPCAEIECSNGDCKVKTRIYSTAPSVRQSLNNSDKLDLEPTPISECITEAVKVWNRRV